MTALSICYLADHTEVVPDLAAWFAKEWGDGSEARTAAGYERQVSHAANADHLPICLIGLIGVEPVATATLKFREIEYSPGADYWLGWVCVREDMRGRGFGRALVGAVEAQAVARGMARLYLHTPSREAFYLQLGWKTLGLTTAEGRRSTVMTKAFSDVDPTAQSRAQRSL
jgi:GNAT superfamily N-acetyltransferase